MGMTTLFFQNIVNGLLLGGVYALMAVGISLVWGIQQVSNSSQAAFSILAAYIAYWLFTIYHIDPFVTILICVPLFFVSGVLIYQNILSRIQGKNAVLMIFLATYGIGMFMENGMILTWSGINRGITTDYSGLSFQFAGLSFPMVRVACFIISITIILGLTAFLKYTRTGKAMRAVSQNRDAALLMGVNVDRIYRITYGIGVATSGAVGPLIGLIYIFSPPTQSEWVMLLYSIVVVGGMGSIFGTLISSMLIAVLQMVIPIYLSYTYGFLATYILLLTTLLLRPKKGLFGV